MFMNWKIINAVFVVLLFFFTCAVVAGSYEDDVDFEETDVDEVSVLYVATPGFYAFNFMEFVGSMYRGAKFDVDFVPGYEPDGTWSNPHPDFYALAEGNYDGYDVVFLDMVNMYRKAFQTGADSAAANGTILISIMTGPTIRPPHICYMPMSFTIRDHPELSTGPYSTDKEFINDFFDIYSYERSGQPSGEYQYEDEKILAMRNLLMDEVIERKSPYEFCKIDYKDKYGMGDVYVMKNFEPSDKIRHVHKGTILEFVAVPAPGYDLVSWEGAVQDPNNKSKATLCVENDTNIRAVFKSTSSTVSVRFLYDSNNSEKVVTIPTGSVLPAFYPRKEGYRFFGWKHNNTSIAPDFVVNGDIQLTADWVKLPILVEGGESPSLTDVLILLKFISQSGSNSDLSEADMIGLGADLDRNGKIDLIDVLLYLKSI